MPVPHAILPSILSRLMRWYDTLWRRSDWQRQRTHLLELDDHQLRDIGLTREDIAGNLPYRQSHPRRRQDPHL